jgi:cell division protein FtsI (penicillin-binding protein 3)
MLDGTDGSATYETGAGNRIPLGDNSVVPPQAGEDLMLTIDRDVQWYTQRVLRQAVQASGGESGAAVVMDSRTGEVLALADHPTFDAN